MFRLATKSLQRRASTLKSVMLNFRHFSSRASSPSLSIWRRKKEMGKEALIIVKELKRLKSDGIRFDRFMKSQVSRLLRSDLVAVLDEVQCQDQVFLSMKDPSIKELAAQIAKDPAFTQLAEQHQQSIELEGGYVSHEFDPRDYYSTMQQVMQNPTFMTMAECLGNAVIQDPCTFRVLESLDVPLHKEEVEEGIMSIREDSFLKQNLQEIECGGPAAMTRYWNDPEVLEKLGQAIGLGASGGVISSAELSALKYETGNEESIPIHTTSVGDVQDPSIKELAAQIAKDPAFIQMAEQQQQSIELEGGYVSHEFDPREYSSAMQQVMQNPTCMTMAERLGNVVIQDPCTPRMLEVHIEELEERITSIEEDSFLKRNRQEIECGGPSAMTRYWNDPEVLEKLGQAMGLGASGGVISSGELSALKYETRNEEESILLNNTSVGDVQVLRGTGTVLRGHGQLYLTYNHRLWKSKYALGFVRGMVNVPNRIEKNKDGSITLPLKDSLLRDPTVTVITVDASYREKISKVGGWAAELGPRGLDRVCRPIVLGYFKSIYRIDLLSNNISELYAIVVGMRYAIFNLKKKKIWVHTDSGIVLGFVQNYVLKGKKMQFEKKGKEHLEGYHRELKNHLNMISELSSRLKDFQIRDSSILNKVADRLSRMDHKFENNDIFQEEPFEDPEGELKKYLEIETGFEI